MAQIALLKDGTCTYKKGLLLTRLAKWNRHVFGSSKSLNATLLREQLIGEVLLLFMLFGGGGGSILLAPRLCRNKMLN